MTSLSCGSLGYVAALALVVPLGLAPLREAAAQRTSTAQWSFGVGSAKPLTVSAVIRRLPGFSELEYDDTSHVRGLTADLNGDGRADYIIQSAESLCGNGGCDYLIVDGATRREIGTVFGGTVYVDPHGARHVPGAPRAEPCERRVGVVDGIPSDSGTIREGALAHRARRGAGQSDANVAASRRRRA